MTYEELAIEYEKSISAQKKVIKDKLMHLSQAKKALNFKEIKRLNSLLCILYAEKSELEERKKGLIDYMQCIENQKKAKERLN